MSAHSQGSSARSNAYSANRCSNWATFDPWFSEIESIYKKFDKKISTDPAFPKVIQLPPQEGFLSPCHRVQVEAKLRTLPQQHLTDLRAIFILPGTRKQLKSWYSPTACYGNYWRRCIFLHAHPVHLGQRSLDELHHFFLNDVLIHEIGHHIDHRSNITTKQSEAFANGFVFTAYHDRPADNSPAEPPLARLKVLHDK